jgi:cytochrome P450
VALRLSQHAAILLWKQYHEAEKCSVRAFKRASGLVADNKKRHANGDPDEMQVNFFFKELYQGVIDFDLLAMFLQSKRTGENFVESAFIVEATGFVLAGSHTMSNSLTWIV